MSNEGMTPGKFFQESLRNIKTVGTITRSSRFVCRKMTNPIDFSRDINVIELGAGDGVITKHILDKMSAQSKLFIFEVNDTFIKKLNEINDPRLIVVHDSAEYMEKYINEHGVSEVDYVISALPFVVLPDELAGIIVGKAAELLKTGGKLVQIHYSLVLKKLYQQIFGNVKVGFVPLNIPPAFILVSQKEQEAA